MSARASEERPRSDSIEASDVEASHQDDMERQLYENNPQVPLPKPRWAKSTRTSIFNKVMAVVNIALGFILATSIGVIANESTRLCDSKSVGQSIEHYSPAMEAVIPVVRKFKPDPRYQTEDAEELEAAWQEVIGPTSGVVALDDEESKNLPRTNHESMSLEPGKHVYSLSMYQQLRCLNTIRQSFYRDVFYSDRTDEEFRSQKNDCFDFLRQAIQCHGDVSMMQLTLESGLEKTSSRTDLVTKIKNASVLWDVEHSCRALAPIEEWVSSHQLD